MTQVLLRTGPAAESTLCREDAPVRASRGRSPLPVKNKGIRQDKIKRFLPE